MIIDRPHSSNGVNRRIPQCAYRTHILAGVSDGYENIVLGHIAPAPENPVALDGTTSAGAPSPAWPSHNRVSLVAKLDTLLMETWNIDLKYGARQHRRYNLKIPEFGRSSLA